jgi:hypothetical protein
VLLLVSRYSKHLGGLNPWQILDHRLMSIYTLMPSKVVLGQSKQYIAISHACRW